MRLESLQTQNSDGQNQIKLMSGVVPTDLTKEGSTLRLRAGWLTPCMLLGYLMIAIALAQLWAAATVIADPPFRPRYLMLIPLLLIQFALIAWIFSHRVHWTIDKNTIARCSMVPWWSKPMQWECEDAREVMLVEQGNFSFRFQALAPGIWIKTSRDRIDLGASGDITRVYEIARTIALTLDVPLTDTTREGIFAEFRAGRRKFALWVIPLALAIVALIHWLTSR